MKKINLQTTLILLGALFISQITFGFSEPKVEKRYSEASGLIQKNDTVELLRMIKDGFKANCVYSKGSATLLDEAVQKGTLAFTRILINNGADPVACSEFGSIPLHTAIFNKKWDIVEYLFSLNQDIFPNEKTIKKASDKPQEFQRRDYNGYILRDLIVLNRIDFLEKAIIRGINVNYGFPLILACYLGNYEAAKLLFDHGADAGIYMKSGMGPYFEQIPRTTPLFAAVRGGNRNIINMILNSKATVNPTEAYWVYFDYYHGGVYADNSLMAAKRLGLTDIAETLKTKGWAEIDSITGLPLNDVRNEQMASVVFWTSTKSISSQNSMSISISLENGNKYTDIQIVDNGENKPNCQKPEHGYIVHLPYGSKYIIKSDYFQYNLSTRQSDHFTLTRTIDIGPVCNMFRID
jgi:ankyrin repeat protein